MHESESESEVLSHIWRLGTPWIAAYQAPPSMGVSSQEHWSGVPLPSPVGGLLLLLSYFSRVQLCVTPQMAAYQAPPSLGFSRQDTGVGCHFLIQCILPSIFPSNVSFPMSQLFASIFAKYWSFSFSISPSNEYSGLISFSMDWFDLLTVQGTLKSLLQHHSSKASILQHSAFFIFQLLNPYMTIGKTIALTRRTFVRKVMSLLFNMLYRLVIAFLPRSKCLLISWLQSPCAVILEPKKIKFSYCFNFFPISLQWSDGNGCHNLSFLNVEF